MQAQGAWVGARAAGALLLAVTGCATLPEGPPGALLLAQAALARAADAPLASWAPEEIAEAEAALAAAERANAEAPGSARADDDAYVALRAAEKAQIAGRYAAAREALFKARRAASHLAADLARREAFFADLAARRAAQAEATAALGRALAAALGPMRGAGACPGERPGEMLVRFAVEEMFLPGTSLLRDGADDRIAALCACLGAAPPFEIRIAIVDDVEGFRTAPARLSQRRYDRIREAMCARGVPAAAFLPRSRRAPPGAQIDVTVIAKAPPLPPAG